MRADFEVRSAGSVIALWPRRSPWFGEPSFWERRLAIRSLIILTLGIDLWWVRHRLHLGLVSHCCLGFMRRFHLFHRARRHSGPNNASIIQDRGIERLSGVPDLARQVHEIVRRRVGQKVYRVCGSVG